MTFLAGIATAIVVLAIIILALGTWVGWMINFPEET